MSAPVIAGRAAAAGAKRASGGRAAARKRTSTGVVERQKAAIQAIKDARPATMSDPAPSPSEPVPKPDTPPAAASSSSWSAPDALTDRRGDPRWLHTDKTSAANTGAGFLLGLGLWALGLAYLEGGAPAVKRLLRSKFLNKTDGGAR